jgi:hypothetical protein
MVALCIALTCNADFGSHVVVVEIDEHKHEQYECSCENKRMMAISRDFDHRPLVFLRFNPDAYLFRGIKHTSCFIKINLESWY